MQKRRLFSAVLTLGVMLFSSLAMAHGPTRQKVTETIEINASATSVWEIVKDFDNAQVWLPMVESSEGEGGNEPGATRILTLGPDVKLYETLKKYDAKKMSYSYKIPVDTHDINILPVNNYSSWLTVTSTGQDTCEVKWKGAFYRGYPNNDPPPELNDDAAVAAVTGVYQAGLAYLKELAESQ